MKGEENVDYMGNQELENRRVHLEKNSMRYKREIS